MSNKSIYNLSFVLYLVYAIMVYTSVYVPSPLIYIVFSLWLIVVLPLFGRERLKGIRGLGIFLFFLFICSLGNGIQTAFGRLLVFIQACSPIIAFHVYKNDRKKVLLFAIVFILLLIFNETYAFRNISSIWVSGLRATRSYTSDQDQEMFKNGFEMVYSFSALIPLFVYSIINHKRWSLKGKAHYLVLIGLVLLSIAFTVFIYLAMFMTAILIVAIGVVIAVVYGKKRWALKTTIGVGLVVCLFMSFYDDIIREIGTDEVTSAFVTDKLEELHSTLSGDIVEAEDASSRKGLTSSSFHTFIENPIIGVFYKMKSMDDYERGGIGNHSEWLDMMGLYGLFSFLIFRFLYLAYMEQKKYSSVTIHLLLYFIIGFLNPLWSVFNNISYFMLAPFLIVLLFPGRKVFELK